LVAEDLAHRLVAQLGDPLDRADKFVVEGLGRAGVPASRATVQKWMHAGRVTSAGQPLSPSDRLSLGAVVEVMPLPREVTLLEPDAAVPFVVLYEDDHLIVVDKPGGVVVHPARGHAHGTLVHGLLARGGFEKVLTASQEPGQPDSERSVRPGIVHRLDKGTSGVLVVAKDEPTREGLKLQFARHDIERVYLALVVGTARDATIETLHGRHRSDRLKFTSHVTQGKRAVTRVKLIERFASGDASLVECRLETGRTHQIRVHLSERAGTPIVGDPLYGRAPKSGRLAEVSARLQRQALHAAVLGFRHPISAAALRFERQPPPDFMWALDLLRRAEPPRRA
jgi:23S rRNA pseudouridine1911/1915/1917 synthase